ncbi:hypothetical protein TWF481_000119 [Arthrobotrys musiformis]|uniref:Nucleoside phosphorylase domain-containing protein n=1 Tax=Arthrobotrys musiformis TaxID=47236 RepID=A0AAV9WNG4_9PEZI
MASNIQEYNIALVCALSLEMAAVTAMMDEVYGGPAWQVEGDTNNYTLGRIGRHYVVAACLPDGVYGMTATTALIHRLLSSYRSIRFGVVVGIGGGVPSDNGSYDMRLGDVVVSKPNGASNGVILYDFGKAIDKDGSIVPNASPFVLPGIFSTAVSSLSAGHMRNGNNNISHHISAMFRKYPNMQERFAYPGAGKDFLYDARYNHAADSHLCGRCDPGKLVARPSRNRSGPEVHYGTIGSGNLVIKDGTMRDRLARQHNIICFEMEAAGLIGQFSCLIVRGICDYADSHKNKIWQEYAAATAAAYAKELLLNVPVSDHDSPEIGSPSTIGSRPSFPTPRSVSTGPTEILPRSFILTNRFYTKDGISLGSLVPDRRYPNQDAFVSSDIILENGRDFLVSVDTNFNAFVDARAKSSSAFKRALGKLFLPPFVKGVEGDVRVISKESCVYTLLQPRTLFKKLSQEDHFNEWLRDGWVSKKTLYFIVGYRTVIDAQFIGKEIKPSRNRRLPAEMADRAKVRYDTSGERIYAVCFRRVKFEQSTGKKGRVLEQTNKWRIFPKHRGAGGELEEEVSADISDDDEIGASDFGVFPSRAGAELWTGL